MMVRDRGQQVVSTAVFSQGILQNRIIESVELKGTSEGNLVQLPCNEQGHHSWIRLPRALSSLALNVSRDGASTTTLGSLCQCLTTLTVKYFLCKSSLNLPSFSLKPFPLVLLPQTLLKSLSPSFL